MVEWKGESANFIAQSAPSALNSTLGNHPNRVPFGDPLCLPGLVSSLCFDDDNVKDNNICWFGRLSSSFSPCTHF